VSIRRLSRFARKFENQNVGKEGKYCLFREWSRKSFSFQLVTDACTYLSKFSIPITKYKLLDPSFWSPLRIRVIP